MKRYLRNICLPLMCIFASFIGGGLWSYLSGSYVFAKYNPGEISARVFNVIDKQGKRRASWGINEEGHPVLIFRDNEQNVVVFLGSGKRGPIFGMNDAHDNMRLFLRYSKNTGPLIALMRKNKMPSFTIGVSDNGSPALAFFDRNGVGRMTLALKPDGSPAIGMLGPDKQSRLHIQAPEDRGPMITMHPGSDRPAVVLGLIHDRPVLTLYTRYRSGVVAGVNQSGEPVLGLMRNGQTTWTPAGAASPSADQDLERAVDDLLQ